jgi:hypothetical protein
MKILVNGTTVECPESSSISLVNGKLIINDMTTDVKPANDLKIEVIGGLINLKVERGSVIVNGDVKGYVDAAGNVEVNGSVGGKVDASGNITCGDVEGDVDAGGNVMCGKVSGDVDAGGNVIGVK